MARENWIFVSAAYAATWLTVTVYWVHVHRSVRRARRAYDVASSAGAAPGGSAP